MWLYCDVIFSGITVAPLGPTVSSLHAHLFPSESCFKSPAESALSGATLGQMDERRGRKSGVARPSFPFHECCCPHDTLTNRSCDCNP